MAEEFWKSSPFGKDSIFHPSWEEKQKEKRFADYKGVKIKEIKVVANCLPRNSRRLLSSPAFIKSTNIVSSDSNSVMVSVKVIVYLSNRADEVKITLNKNSTITATKSIGKSVRYEANFRVKVGKSLARIDQYNSQEFTFTATVRDIFTKEISDTSSVKVIIDTNGKVSSTSNQTCFCNRDFTVEEMIEIIYLLKDKFFIKTDREKFFDQGGKETINQIKINTGKISDNKKQIKIFTNELNRMFDKFGLNQCETKIHFLGQMYTETSQLRSTYENRKAVPANYKGGVDFQGRGMKQITHNYNYLAYFDYVNDTKHYETFDKYRGKKNDVKEVILNKIPNNKSNGLTIDFYDNTLVPFTKKLSTDIYHAFDSAGWYCVIHNPKVINAMRQGVSKKNILLVSRAINGNVTTPNNLSRREKATLVLVDFFKNKKKCSNN